MAFYSLTEIDEILAKALVVLEQWNNEIIDTEATGKTSGLRDTLFDLHLCVKAALYRKADDQAEESYQRFIAYIYSLIDDEEADIVSNVNYLEVGEGIGGFNITFDISFNDITDLDNPGYATKKGFLVGVNQTETGIEFIDPKLSTKVHVSAGEALAYGDVAYIGSDGNAYLADRRDEAKIEAIGFVGLAALADEPTFLYIDYINIPGAGLTKGKPVYVTGEGNISQVIPQDDAAGAYPWVQGNDWHIQIGIAITETLIKINGAGSATILKPGPRGTYLGHYTSVDISGLFPPEEEVFTAQTSVTVTHNRGVRPNPVIYKLVSGNYVQMTAAVEHTTVNSFIVTFASSQTGIISY